MVRAKMTTPDAEKLACRTIFHEDWWLDVVTRGDFKKIEIEQGGKVVATLPYWYTSGRLGSYCGLPPINRILSPLFDLDARKTESINRSKSALIGEIITRLPRADHVRFVLGPQDTDALAWQLHGFATRIIYTYVLETAGSFDPMRKLRDTTRRTILRAQQVLHIETMSAEQFASFYVANLGGEKPYYDLSLLTPLQIECAERGRGAAFAAVDASGKMHAAIFFVWDDSDYYYFLPTRDTGVAHMGATAMLVLHGIEQAKGMGLRFDLDGITTNERARFLVNFGGNIKQRTIVERFSYRLSVYRASKVILRVKDNTPMFLR
jgi:hypothetical protein